MCAFGAAETAVAAAALAPGGHVRVGVENNLHRPTAACSRPTPSRSSVSRIYAAPDDPGRLERREQHLSYAARYKGTDGFGPIGPWLVTRDEVPDPDDLDVTCTVGGPVVAEDSTRYYNYAVAEVLAFVSRFQTLEPGDIVSMGTAFREKQGTTRSIHTADLQRVDGPVSVTIDRLGTLVTPIRRVPGELGRWRLDGAA